MAGDVTGCGVIVVSAAVVPVTAVVSVLAGDVTDVIVLICGVTGVDVPSGVVCDVGSALVDGVTGVDVPSGVVCDVGSVLVDGVTGVDVVPGVASVVAGSVVVEPVVGVEVGSVLVRGVVLVVGGSEMSRARRHVQHQTSIGAAVVGQLEKEILLFLRTGKYPDLSTLKLCLPGLLVALTSELGKTELIYTAHASGRRSWSLCWAQCQSRSLGTCASLSTYDLGIHYCRMMFLPKYCSE